MKIGFGDYGTCCVCENEILEIDDPVLLQLDYKVVSESGWGCLVCGLKFEGAVAIVCGSCFDKYGDSIVDEIKYLMDGRECRIPVPLEETRVPHEHDLSKHEEELYKHVGVD